MKISWSTVFLAVLAGGALASPAETPAQNGEVKRHFAPEPIGKRPHEAFGRKSKSTHRASARIQTQRRAISEQQNGPPLFPVVFNNVFKLVNGILRSKDKPSSPSPTYSYPTSSKAYGKPTNMPSVTSPPTTKPHGPLFTAPLSTYGGPRRANTAKPGIARPTTGIYKYMYGGPRKAYRRKLHGYIAPYGMLMPTASAANPYGATTTAPSSNPYDGKPNGETPTTSSTTPTISSTTSSTTSSPATSSTTPPTNPYGPYGPTTELPKPAAGYSRFNKAKAPKPARILKHAKFSSKFRSRRDLLRAGYRAEDDETSSE
ncbi:hypothetical protein OCS_01048 [Ophiocordyceps sinensis CO18]|uniref:Uncharacterized protein n=1 Tax=Ophiocordyceps sinensis (strain Co18 / CGMCC 3.14243) TaxID=911162 RepID=T5AKZ1_OPHSC|nr:hypothetical protein OCS_01048 [Ophiocordyceps sinensis CO18]